MVLGFGVFQPSYVGKTRMAMLIHDEALVSQVLRARYFRQRYFFRQILVVILLLFGGEFFGDKSCYNWGFVSVCCHGTMFVFIMIIGCLDQ